jgi:hypothetical protein
MNGFLQPTNGYPQPYEFIEDLVTQLKTLAILDTALADGDGNGGKENVYAHRLPVARPQGDGYVLVREVLPAGGRSTTTSGLQKITFQVSTESKEGVENPEHFHSAVHNRIADYILSSWAPTPTKSDISVPVRRVIEPTSVRWDDKSRTFYSVADYVITLSPFIDP